MRFSHLDVVAINPQLFITATFVALVVVLALGVALLVLLESRDAQRQDR